MGSDIHFLDVLDALYQWERAHSIFKRSISVMLDVGLVRMSVVDSRQVA